MTEELVDICDEKNNLLGIQKTKTEAHRVGLWHRSAHIWIYNSKGEILLQLRAKDKALYPDLWDVSVAGHVSAGEDPMISGLREIREEIGLKVNQSDLRFYKILKRKQIFRKIINSEFFYIYLLKFDGDISKLKLQKEEVQKIKFISIEKIKENLKNKQADYVPHGDYWLEAMEEVKKRL